MKVKIPNIQRLSLLATMPLAIAGFSSKAVLGSEYSDGYINVLDYGATSGGGDDTVAIRNAIAAAYDDNIDHLRAVYFPSGTYHVSETIELTQNYPPEGTGTVRPGHMLIGEGGPNRPKIKLMDGSDGFGSATTPKPVFRLWKEDSGGNERASIHFNTLIRNLKIDLGEDNHGAIAIDFLGAEGCAITDVDIFSSTSDSFFAGLQDLPGSGGSVTNLKVTGGKYGIYLTESREGPVLTAIYLQDQEDYAIYSIYDSPTSKGFNFTPLTVVGFKFVKENGPVLGPFPDDGHETGSNLALVDGTIEITATSGNLTAIEHDGRNVHLRNVYVKGVKRIVDDTSDGDDTNTLWSGYGGNSSIWRWLEYFADGPHYTAGHSRIVNGTGQTSPISSGNTTSTPTVDYLAKHGWTQGFADSHRTGVVNVKDAPYNATGNGTTDDTAAIQDALDGGGLVFLPKGTYKITQPLIIPPDTEFFGVSHSISILDAQSMSGVSPSAVIVTANDAQAECALSDIKIVLPDSTTGIGAVLWRAGRNSIMRDIWPVREPDGPASNPAGAAHRLRITSGGGGRIYNWLGMFKWDSNNSSYRNVYVEGTSEPLAFYMLHSQYMWCSNGYRSEFYDAQNVAIYGNKLEEDNDLNPSDSSIAVPIQFTDCDNIQLIAPSGQIITATGKALVQFENSSNYSLANLGNWTLEGGSFNYVEEDFTGTINDTAIAADTSLFVNYLSRGTPDYVTGDGVELLSATYNSVGSHDGFVVEQSETSETGGSTNASPTGSYALRVGDNSSDCQYKSILSFNTASLPDGAIVVSATLRLKTGVVIGTNPFTTHGTCHVDIKGGSGFNNSLSLENADFQAPADASEVATLNGADNAGERYSASINATGLSHVNLTGHTQLRIYLETDDNDDNSDDYHTWYPGDATNADDKAELAVTYYIP